MHEHLNDIWQYGVMQTGAIDVHIWHVEQPVQDNAHIVSK